MRNTKVAAAVAAALGVGAFTASHAATGPGTSAAMTATHNVFIAGSSAAANAVINYVEATICGGSNFSAFTTPTSAVGQPDFRAVACGNAQSPSGFSGSTVTVWYRPEGGSAVGVLPVSNGNTIKQLNMNTAGCSTTSTSTASSAYTCTAVAGTTPGNGTDDSFGPAGVTSHVVDIGVSDLEPAVFGNPNTATALLTYAGGGNNDPAGSYTSALTGGDISTDTASNLGNITFQQAFGFIVGVSVHNAGVTDLPRTAIANIFGGGVSSWNQVTVAVPTGATDGKVALNNAPQICNRETGSGTRASADIFLFQDGCIAGASNLADVTGQPTDNFQTIAELDCVNSHPNSIGYVSIDNFAKTASASSSSFPSVYAIAVDGVSAYGSAVNAAAGEYEYWFESSINPNPNNTSTSDATKLFTAMQASGGIGDENANVGSSYNVMAIPGFITGSNPATAPLTQGSHGVYVNDFSRGGNSCHQPTHG